MEAGVVIRAIIDKGSDLLLVAVFFGMQAALATGQVATWIG